MSQAWLRMLSAAALFAAGCGQRPTQPGGDTKGGKPGDGGVKVVPAPTAGAAFDRIPKSAFLAMGLGRPAKTAARVKELLAKAGISPETNAEFKKGLDEFKADAGFDPFDPEGAKKLGVDADKGLALAVDAKFLARKTFADDYSGTVTTTREPIVYAVLPLADAKAFEAFMRERLPKDKKGYRLEDAAIGDAKALYGYEQRESYVYTPPPSPAVPMPTPPPPATEEVLDTAIVIKGDTAYVLDGEDVKKSASADVPDSLEAYKKDLEAFVAGLAEPLAGDAAAKPALAKIDIGGDFYFYLDGVRAAEAFAASAPEITYKPPKDESQRMAQDAQRGIYGARDSSAAVFKQIAQHLPAGGFSASIEGDRASMKGIGLVGEAIRAKLEQSLTPAAAVPAYGAVFPETTGLFYRWSLNPPALKELVFAVLPPDIKAEAETGWQQANAAVLAMSGLDLDKDVVAAFTGHFAFGAPGMESTVMPWFLIRRPSPMAPPAPAVTGPPGAVAPTPAPAPPAADRLVAPSEPEYKLPAMMAVAQLTSPAAGDKLLTTLAGFGPKMGVEFKTEDVGGDKLYSAKVEDGIVLAWGRVGDLLIGGNEPEAIKAAFARAKTPGASFADKLSSPLAKALVTGKAESGMATEVGQLFTALAAIPDIEPQNRELLGKLGAMFGGAAFSSRFEDGALQVSGELMLK